MSRCPVTRSFPTLDRLLLAIPCSENLAESTNINSSSSSSSSSTSHCPQPTREHLIEDINTDGTMLAQRAEPLPLAGHADYYLWKYVPSMAAAVIFIVLFLGLSVAHSWKMFRHRMWFCTVFVLGGYLEVVGFVGRAASTNATDQLGPYIVQSVFLLVPPSLFAASIYMTLGRIMTGLGPAGEACSIIRVRWMTRIFVVGDVFSFLIQSSGAGMMAAGSDPKMGEIIVVAGLVIQILFFGLFVAAAAVFHMRYRQHDVGSGRLAAGSSDSLDEAGGRFPWQRMMMMLYATSALILVRSLFRIVEYVMGSDGYLLANEWPLYVFDGLLMAATMVVFYVWYPSEIRSSRGHKRGQHIALDSYST